VFFEPNEEMYRLTSQALAKFPEVIGLKLGLSHQSGKQTFLIPEGGSTTGTLEAEKTGVKGRRVEIQCSSADELVQNETLKPPTVIKIDTEGHERAVLEGMYELISRDCPKIFFEHISMTDAEVRQLVPNDYLLYTVADKDGQLVAGLNRALGHNSALIPAVGRE
jgi:FkbM family methyltransferase